jgi:hypothetical protein
VEPISREQENAFSKEIKEGHAKRISFPCKDERPCKISLRALMLLCMPLGAVNSLPAQQVRA